MGLQFTVNPQNIVGPRRPVVFCLPDTQDSARFVTRCYDRSINLILVLKPSWLKSTDVSRSVAFMVVDDTQVSRAPEVLEALAQVMNALPGLKKIDFFFAFAELNIELLNAVIEGARQYGPARLINPAFRDKLKMRELARVKGITCPQFMSATQLLSSSQLLDAFIERVSQSAQHKGNPLGFVLKPRMSWGALDVQVFEDTTALWQALVALPQPEHYLVEEKITGQLVHVDTARFEGAPVYYGIGVYDTSLLSRPSTAARHLKWHTMRPDTTLGERLMAFSDQVMTHFQLATGFSHTEIFIEHNTGALVLCESAARPPGMHVFDLYAMGHEPHAFDRFVDVLATEQRWPPLLANTRKTLGMVVFNPTGRGTLKALTPIETIVDADTVHWDQFAQPGDRFVSDHYTVMLGRIVCRCDDETRCRALLAHYDSRFHCEFEDT